MVSIHLKNISQNGSKWIISPNRGENKQYLKPPPSIQAFFLQIKSGKIIYKTERWNHDETTRQPFEKKELASELVILTGLPHATYFYLLVAFKNWPVKGLKMEWQMVKNLDSIFSIWFTGKWFHTSSIKHNCQFQWINQLFPNPWSAKSMRCMVFSIHFIPNHTSQKNMFH